MKRVLVISLIVVAFFNCEPKPKAGSVKNDSSQQIQQSAYSNSRLLERNTNGLMIDDVALVDRLDSIISLRSLIDKNDKKLIFHYSNLCCRPCVQYFLNIITDLAKKHDSKIIIIAYNLNQMEVLAQHAEIGFNVQLYRITQFIDLPINDTLVARPFIFLINNELKVSNARICHVEDNTNPEYLAALERALR